MIWRQKSKNTYSFFVNWNILVNKGKEKQLNKFLNQLVTILKQEEDLKFILLKLAHNYTGIPIENANDWHLEHDAIKAMSDLVHYDITNSF